MTLSASSTCVALIPARLGSKRVPAKNVRELAGHPLLAYSISAAGGSGVYSAVVVSTESQVVREAAERYGAEVPFLRPVEFAADDSPDIDWVRYTLQTLARQGRTYDCFSILRPTSPFRKAATIQRAWRAFLSDGEADSLRAVQLCREHPAKMWLMEEHRIRPLMATPPHAATPWHSSPYQSLPPVYIQNASLEISRCQIPLHSNSISGEQIMPFMTEGLEGFDINSPDDWRLAEHHAREQPDALPTVSIVT